MNTTLLVLLGLAMLAVLGVLFLGLGAMVRGGGFHDRNSNRLMRWRVALQALALVLFALAILTASR